MKILFVKYFKPAFTLAEVLITLGIIGIVAAMTIPTLMQKTQDAELKSAWKKNYSILSQAVQQLVSDNAGTLKYICNTDDGACLVQTFTKYLKVLSVCHDNSSWQCLAKPKFLSGREFDDDNSIQLLTDLSTSAILTLSDGSILFIHEHDASCSYINGNPCGWMLIDVNGMKKPNTIGKDIFLLTIMENRVLPFGAKDAITALQNVDDCNSSGGGYTCAEKYLRE